MDVVPESSLPLSLLQRFEESIRIAFYRDVGGRIPDLADYPNCIIVDLANIVSEFHLRNGILKALLSSIQGSGFRSPTSTFASDVLYHLSASGSIAETRAQFSPTTATSAFAVVGICTQDESHAMFSSLMASVRGVQFDSGLLLTDSMLATPEKQARVVKLFKVSPLELTCSTLEDAVITRLAVKAIM